jgi:Ni/Co efflux regulator RcnB
MSMRTPIILALMGAAAAPSIAQAQSAGEIRHDDREIARDRRDLRHAELHGDRGDIRDARRELHEDRRDRRQDWRDYRETHRAVYRRPAYVGPHGYAYRPVAIGHRFEPVYYERRYVIADPWTYRLPPPLGWTRWVRYGDDAVLVNIRTGRVVEVHNHFFW